MGLETGPCLGLSFTPVPGVRTAQVFTVSLSWVRPKANGGRPGHVSHPLVLCPRIRLYVTDSRGRGKPRPYRVLRETNSRSFFWDATLGLRPVSTQIAHFLDPP